MSAVARLIHGASRLYWWAARPVTVGVRRLLVRGQTVLLVKHTYQDQWQGTAEGRETA